MAFTKSKSAKVTQNAGGGCPEHADIMDNNQVQAL